MAGAAHRHAAAAGWQVQGQRRVGRSSVPAQRGVGARSHTMACLMDFARAPAGGTASMMGCQPGSSCRRTHWKGLGYSPFQSGSLMTPSLVHFLGSLSEVSNRPTLFSRRLHTRTHTRTHAHAHTPDAHTRTHTHAGGTKSTKACSCRAQLLGDAVARKSGGATAVGARVRACRQQRQAQAQAQGSGPQALQLHAHLFIIMKRLPSGVQPSSCPGLPT